MVVFGVGEYLHLVQRRSDVAHHGHEEEGYLENSMLEIVQSVHNTFIPCRVVHVDEERYDP